MPTADATITTDRPSRYLTQLCQHIRHLGDESRTFRHRPDDPPRMSIVESSETHAIVDFTPWGRCTMRAEPARLTLHLETTDEQNLQRLQDILTKNLTRFGRRDQLEVTWHGEEPAAPTHRRRRWVLLGIILAKIVIIALVVALPSGLAISLGAGHLVALALLLAAAAVTAAVAKTRGVPLPALLSRLPHRRH